MWRNRDRVYVYRVLPCGLRAKPALRHTPRHPLCIRRRRQSHERDRPPRQHHRLRLRRPRPPHHRHRRPRLYDRHHLRRPGQHDEPHRRLRERHPLRIRPPQPPHHRDRPPRRRHELRLRPGEQQDQGDRPPRPRHHVRLRRRRPARRGALAAVGHGRHLPHDPADLRRRRSASGRDRDRHDQPCRQDCLAVCV